MRGIKIPQQGLCAKNAGRGGGAYARGGLCARGVYLRNTTVHA